MTSSVSEERYQTPDVPRDDRQIRVGSLLFTMVEPHKGHEVAYNRWYERDHFYAGCMIGAWQFGGARYVATKECKHRRYPKGSPITPDPMVGSYLAVYWVLDGHHDDWNKWGVEQVNWLHANDRMFNERDHIHTALYEYAGEVNAPGSSMPVELALDRAYAGMIVLIGEMADGKGAADVTEWFHGLPCPTDVALIGTPLPLRGDRPSDVPDTQADNRVLIMAWTLDDPIEVFDAKFAALGDAFSKAGLGEIVFASPFRSTVPGTDTYTDELW
ncbi:MAG: hypothetical protein FJW86_06220 [Actinobacteria bacterium]|nr:hypothetical protein [Actinomycetota bacterium]